MRRVGGMVLLCCVATSGARPAHAAPADDVAARLAAPDLEVARRRYQAGVQAYDRGDYEAALREFTAAREAKPLSGLDYDIGRCHDRLGRWAEAADAYERYLAAAPGDSDAAELRTRIAELRARAKARAAERADAARLRSLRLGAGLTAGAAVVLAGAGTGAYLSAWPAYQEQRAGCQHQCPPESLGSLRGRVVTAEASSGVLWGLAGVALVVDVVLWAKLGRVRAELHAATLP